MGRQINGPHQGGWVELKSGESWFIHFKDRGAFGRIVHLRVSVVGDAVCAFGLFAIGQAGSRGHANYNWFRTTD